MIFTDTNERASELYNLVETSSSDAEEVSLLLRKLKLNTLTCIELWKIARTRGDHIVAVAVIEQAVESAQHYYDWITILCHTRQRHERPKISLYHDDNV